MKQPEIDPRVYDYLADNDAQDFSEFLRLQRKNDQENQDESKQLLAVSNRTLVYDLIFEWRIMHKTRDIR